MNKHDARGITFMRVSPEKLNLSSESVPLERSFDIEMLLNLKKGGIAASRTRGPDGFHPDGFHPDGIV